jgi:hypothetical protein
MGERGVAVSMVVAGYFNEKGWRFTYYRVTLGFRYQVTARSSFIVRQGRVIHDCLRTCALDKISKIHTYVSSLLKNRYQH